MLIGGRRGRERWALAGLCLGLIHAGTAAADTKAFVGARIFDGSGKAIIEKGTIVVQDGKIAAIGPSNKVKSPKGAQTIDVSGKTVTPGLINAHGHVSDVEGKRTGASEESVARQLSLFPLRDHDGLQPGRRRGACLQAARCAGDAFAEPCQDLRSGNRDRWQDPAGRAADGR